MQASVMEWLEKTAVSYPDKAAITDEFETLTFSKVREKSLAIAEKIITLKKGVQKPIVVYMEKSAKTLVAFFRSGV